MLKSTLNTEIRSLAFA